MNECPQTFNMKRINSTLQFQLALAQPNLKPSTPKGFSSNGAQTCFQPKQVFSEYFLLMKVSTRHQMKGQGRTHPVKGGKIITMMVERGSVPAQPHEKPISMFSIGFILC